MRHFTGIVESLDGSGERKPFADLDQLGKILNSHVGDKKKRRKKTGSDVR